MDSQNIPLPYGDSFIAAAVPKKNLRSVIRAKDVPGLADEREALRQALLEPTGSAPLFDRVNGTDRVLVITTDNTRPCPDDRILPVLLEELERRVPRENISIIVALGLHAPLSREELAAKLGRDIVDGYRVLNHDPDDTVNLGTTSRGTPVEVSREITKADFIISLGFIEPHFFAGFSGGRKSIAPGLSSAHAIRKNHGYTMIEHPRARAGILEGNPIHEDMVEQAKAAGLDFIVNVLLNEEKRITHVFAGDPYLAHERGCEVEKEIVQVPIDEPVDITIVTNGGAPLDLDFYQTCKGIYTAAQITRPGGVIIIASCCTTGIGPEAFEELHVTSRSPGEVLETLRDERHVGVGWQNQILAHAQADHSVYLLSGLDDEAARRMKVTPIHTIEEGVDLAFGEVGTEGSIAVIPQGPFVLPVLTS